MPVIETDMVFAFLNPDDHLHDIAERLFRKIAQGYEVELPSSVLLEIELIYKSEGREKDLLTHIANLTTIPHISIVPITPKLVLLSIKLRNDYILSFFDSHHAAVALQGDGMLIGTDQMYNEVCNLQLIDPKTLVTE